jgi:tetratricopeptide (TPR) repeat protein
MKKLFFSVAGQDIKFAEELFDHFSPTDIYLYSKSGKEGAYFWDEIERDALPNAMGVVIFWSEAFLRAEGTARELKFAAKRLQGENLDHAIILRLDKTPIKIPDGETDPKVKAVYAALDVFVNKTRSGIESITIEKARHLIDALLSDCDPTPTPIMPRTALASSFMKSLKFGDWKTYPAIWVSGFNGVGRKTLIEQVFSEFDSNTKPVLVEVSETTTPRQLYQRLSNAAGFTVEKKLELDEPKEIATLLVQIGKTRYTIFRHQRIVEERAELPEWLNDLFNLLEPSARPTLFVISQIPATHERLNACSEKLRAFRVPNAGEDESEEFIRRMVGALDPAPERWTPKMIETLAEVSGGTFDLIVKIVKAAIGREDISKIVDIQNQQTRSFADNMSAYINWAFSEVAGDIDARRTLLLLSNVSPMDLLDIVKFVNPTRTGNEILGPLLGVGLVDRMENGLYHLSPLLAHRTLALVADRETARWFSEATQAFLKSPLRVTNDENQYLTIETRINTALWTSADNIPQDVTAYLGAAQYFQAGLRLYYARKYENAFRVLKRAFDRREKFALKAKGELYRFFGLSAIRRKKSSDADTAIQLLNSNLQTKDLGLYLEAFRDDFAGNYIEAAIKYEQALRNANDPQRESHILRALIACMLKVRPPRMPRFADAASHAQRALEIHRTKYSLKSYASVAIAWYHRGGAETDTVAEDIWSRYKSIMNELWEDPGGKLGFYQVRRQQAYYERNFEDVEMYSKCAVDEGGLLNDYVSRWGLLSQSGDSQHCTIVISEMEDREIRRQFADDWLDTLPSSAVAYGQALVTLKLYSAQKMNKITSGLQPNQIGAVINKIRQPIDVEVAFWDYY